VLHVPPQQGQLCALSDVYGLGLIMCQLLMVSQDSGGVGCGLPACQATGTHNGMLRCAVQDTTDPKAAKRVLQHTAHEHSLHLPPATADWPTGSALAFAGLALHAAAADRQQRPTAASLAAGLRQLLLQVAEEQDAAAAANSRSAAARLVGLRSLQPGIACLVPASLHADGSRGSSSAAAAASAAASTAVAALCGPANSTTSMVDAKAVIAKAAPAAAAKQQQHSGAHDSSRGDARAAAQQLKQEQQALERQAAQLQAFGKSVLMLELLLDPTGSVAGGTITCGASAAAAVSATPSSARTTAGANSSSDPSLQAWCVTGGSWSGGDAGTSSSSILFCCRKGSNSSSTCAFAGTFSRGQLVGSWWPGSVAADAQAVAGAVALQLCQAGSGAAACYDWVMQHGVPEQAAVGGCSSVDAGVAATDRHECAQMSE
jgi:hypothetical protein